MTDTDPTTNPAGITSPRAATDKLLYIAGGFAAVVMLAAVFMGHGETFENKISILKWAFGASALVLGAALSAAGYSTGKLFEGTTPAGFLPSSAKLVTPLAGEVVDLAIAREANPITSVLQGDGTGQALPPIDPANPNQLRQAPARSLSGGVFLALLCLPLFSGGCVGTSAQFRGAVPVGVNNVVQDMREYTAGHDWDVDHNGTVDAVELKAKADEVSLTDALAASIAVQKDITVDGVDAAWKPVESVWRKYVKSDPSLAGDKESTKIRLDTGDLINKLIEVERERQAALRSSLGLFGSK